MQPSTISTRPSLIALLIISPLVSGSSFNTSIRCDESSSILPSPAAYSTPIFSTCSEIIASNTSLQRAYAAVLDFRRYPFWNSFVTSVELPASVSSASDVYIGMPMKFHTQGLLSPFNTTSNEQIAVLSPPGTIGEFTTKDGIGKTAYATWILADGFGGLGVQAEHPYIFTDLGDGNVRIVSYETYYQYVSILISALLKARLQKQFEVQGANLKAYLEQGN